MSSHTPPASDPLAAIRADLVAAGRRLARRRRRRRNATVATVAAAGVLGAAAATAAISDYGTGVPVLDDVLAIHLDRRPPPIDRGGDGGPGRPNLVADLRPGPGGASQPLTLPPARPGRSASGVGVAYVDRNGYVCFVSTGADRRADRGGLGCTMGKLVWRWARRQPAFLTGGGGYGPRSVAHVGFARPDVTAVRVLDARGRAVEAVLGEPWTPRVPGARTLRPFVAVLEHDPDARRPAAILPRGLTAKLADGRVVELGSY